MAQGLALLEHLHGKKDAHEKWWVRKEGEVSQATCEQRLADLL